MNSAVDIKWLDLALGYILLLIPAAVFWYYKTGLVKDTLVAAGRMTVQLILVGLYLEFIFAKDSTLINLAWVFIMVLVAAYTTVQRSELNYRIYLIPVFIASTISILLVDIYFFAVVIRLNNIFKAMYFIPITGMLLGNCIRGNIIAINSYYSRLHKEPLLYRYSLASGASRGEALMPYIRDAIKTSFNPTIATMAVVGLISLPGMMTGQILGGNSPMIAIKYQIMLMITILVASVITVILTMYIANKFVFNDFDILKSGVIRK